MNVPDTNTDNEKTCCQCHKVLGSSYYVSMNAEHSGVEYFYHLGCILISSTLVKRSLKASVVVGTLLLALNQGDFILSGELYKAMIWKIPLTYLVPFCVSSWGSITNAKRINNF